MIRFIDQNGDEIREFDPSCMDAIRSHIENGSANDNVVFLVVAANEVRYPSYTHLSFIFSVFIMWRS